MPRPYYFLSTRVHSVGGPVSKAVTVLRTDAIGTTEDLTSDLIAATAGRDVLFVAHGFNVNQKNGLNDLSAWMDNLDVGNAVPIGILWPGDCFIPIFVDYIVEGHEAIHSGQMLADFIGKSLAAVISVSFSSHSLGARVVLQTIAGLPESLPVRRCVLMAGAIDNTCLIDEYKDAIAKVEQVALMSSPCDDVLKLAYPGGNFLQGVIDRGHPYYKAAIGLQGPVTPYPPAPTKMQTVGMVPKSFDYGHLDYIPSNALPDKFPVGTDIPLGDAPVPPASTPAALATAPHNEWKPALSAAFVSTRLEKP